MDLGRIVDRIGVAEDLDRVAKPVSSAVGRAVAARPVKDILSGRWLGHPLHPLLTDIPIGAWTSAMVLDLLGGEGGREAADRLVAVGVLSALPTAAAGLSDWSDYLGEERRIGLVHAAGNLAAVALYALSFASRRRGHRRSGVALSVLGASCATVGGYLGGHLSYVRGVNVNRNAWETGPGEWTPVMEDGDLVEGQPVAAPAGGIDVLLVRQGGRVHAIADRCGHAGAPLHEGTVEDGCIVCPWHGSVFRLADGDVVHGPATVAQPCFETRLEDGKILVRQA